MYDGVVIDNLWTDEKSIVCPSGFSLRIVNYADLIKLLSLNSEIKLTLDSQAILFSPSIYIFSERKESILLGYLKEAQERNRKLLRDLVRSMEQDNESFRVLFGKYGIDSLYDIFELDVYRIKIDAPEDVILIKLGGALDEILRCILDEASLDSKRIRCRTGMQEVLNLRAKLEILPASTRVKGLYKFCDNVITVAEKEATQDMWHNRNTLEVIEEELAVWLHTLKSRGH